MGQKKRNREPDFSTPNLEQYVLSLISFAQKSQCERDFAIFRECILKWLESDQSAPLDSDNQLLNLTHANVDPVVSPHPGDARSKNDKKTDPRPHRYVEFHPGTGKRSALIERVPDEKVDDDFPAEKFCVFVDERNKSIHLRKPNRTRKVLSARWSELGLAKRHKILLGMILLGYRDDPAIAHFDIVKYALQSPFNVDKPKGLRYELNTRLSGFLNILLPSVHCMKHYEVNRSVSMCWVRRHRDSSLLFPLREEMYQSMMRR